MMRKAAAIATLTACATILIAGNVLACGESLFRVGKGVNFREYTAPLPGNILVVANTEAELALVERLAAAGHDIHVVSDPSEISNELQEHEFDIVLAYYSQREAVEAQTASAASSATYLPVAIEGTAEEAQAEQMFERSLTDDDSVKTFLKTIHRTLKAQS